MNDVAASERRLIKVLITYWEHLRKGAPIPHFSAFNNSLISDVWENCFTVSVMPQADKKTYQYLHAGRQVIEAYGRDPKGEFVSNHIRAVPGASIVERMEECVASRIPIVEQGQFINDKNKMIKFRSCMIPFGNYENNVTHVVVGLSWRVFE